MALRDKLRSRVQPMLEQGETLEHVFLAQTASPWLAIISIWIVIARNGYRIVAVTDRNVIELQAGRMVPSVPKSVIRRLPRSTPVGPVSGRLWGAMDLAGTKVWVHRRFHGEVAAASGA